MELELKAEKDNAEVRVEAVSNYQAIVDAEWEIIYRKLEAVEKTGAKVVLSKLPIGDLATQWFAHRDIFCAGRVPAGDLRRVCQAVGGSVQSTCSDIARAILVLAVRSRNGKLVANDTTSSKSAPRRRHAL